MAEPFLGEIRLFACTYAPFGWLTCNGQILPIQQYSALFSLLGTTYGGNGTTTFALPNLGGRAPLHRGQGPGLSNHALGEAMGTTTVVLAQNQLPVHSHGFEAVSGFAKQATAAGAMVSEMNTVAGGKPSAKPAYTGTASNAQLGANALTASGSTSPAGHQNCQPYQILNFCIATTGMFPPHP
ncbi:MAG TPA: tail fiber protein [Fibrobacteria bacterium]|nr:tail fiber protein [Fibrobacteria bacterium]